jgi:hypothetical protein
MSLRKTALLGLLLCLLGTGACAGQAAVSPAPGLPTQALNTPTVQASPAPTDTIAIIAKETLVPLEIPQDGKPRTRFDEQPDGEATVPFEKLPKAVQAALDRLGKKLSVQAGEIAVIRYEERQWRNSCLGFSAPNEMCADVITPGWLVLLESEGKQYEAHTNASGTQVRIR